MKKFRKVIFFIVIFLILCFSALSIFGFNTRWGSTINHHFKGYSTLCLGNDIGKEGTIILAYNGKLDDEKREEIENVIKDRLNLIGLGESKIHFDQNNNFLTVNLPYNLTNSNLDYKDIGSYLSSSGALKISTTTKSEMDDFLNLKKEKPKETFIGDNGSVNSASLFYKIKDRDKSSNKPKTKIPGIKLSLNRDAKDKLSDYYVGAVQIRKEYVDKKKESNTFARDIERIRKKEKDLDENIEAEKKEKEELEKEKDKLENEKSEKDKELEKLQNTLSSKNVEIMLDNEKIFSGNVLDLFNEKEEIIATNPQSRPIEVLMAINKIKSKNMPLPISLVGIKKSSPKLGLNFKTNILICGSILIGLAILFMALKYRILAAFGSLTILGHLSLILTTYTGFFPFMPGIYLNYSAVLGIGISFLIGIGSFCYLMNKILKELKDCKGAYSPVKRIYKSESRAVIKINILVMIVSAILMGLFSPMANTFSFILKPINLLLENGAQNSVYTFSYSIFFGSIGILIFQILMPNILLKYAFEFNFFKNTKLYGGKNR